MRCALIPLIAFSLFAAACQGQTGPPPASSPSARADAPSTKPVPVSPPPVRPPDALASHNTNWAGVVADVTEFRRKGNVLTAIVRLRNQARDTAVIQVRFSQMSVIDEAGAKKYEVLKDDKDDYIASSGQMEGLVGGGTMTVWMKFPAPPREVRTATLVVPQMPPFESLSIQDQ